MEKGELEWDTLIPWMIGVGVLIIVGVIYFGLNIKGGSIGDYMANLFRFGR